MTDLILATPLLPEKAEKIRDLLTRPQTAQCRFVTYADAMDLMSQVMETLGFQRVDSGGFKGAAFGISDKKGGELLIDFCIMQSKNVVSVSHNYAAARKEDEIICDRLSDQLPAKFVVRIIACLGQSEVVFLPLNKDDVQDAVDIVRSLLNILYDMAKKNGKLALFFAGNELRN